MTEPGPISATQPFGVVHGGRDLVEVLDDAKARVLTGELEGVIVVGITSHNTFGWHGAWKDGAAAPFARLLAAVASCQHDLLTDGLESE